MTTVSYTGDGLLVGNVHYPSCQGSYLIKLLLQCHSTRAPRNQPILDVILESRHGNKHAKEISESMAMVNAIPVCAQRSSFDLGLCRHARVFVVGDGVVPFTALIMLLFLPPTWQYVSIDPLMSFDTSVLGPDKDRVKCVAALSQDVAVTPDLGRPLDSTSSVSFDTAATTGCLSAELVSPAAVAMCASPAAVASLPTLEPSLLSSRRLLGSIAAPVNIVIACHSHAPLQEFWDRVPCPKFCISLPCCGKGWSTLAEEPLYVYDDFEIFSPKRRVYCYFQPG
jgi:hypothetical protein